MRYTTHMEKFESALPILNANDICVIPTDTVYGVVGKLSSKQAVARMYEVKQRDPQKPVGTILAASLEQVAAITTSTAALDVARQYWPGPVSVILPASDDYTYAHKGEMSFAVRIPADEALRAFLEQTGPLASSSANVQAEPPATTVEEAKAYFGSSVPLYIDGGDLSGRAPSKIIRIDDTGTVTVIRS